MAQQAGAPRAGKTMVRPRRSFFTRGRGAPTAPIFAGDPEAVIPAGKREVFPFFAAGIVLAFFALLLCYSKGYLLLYGDAVAHLAIARRILDSRYPGLGQLGGVWLPLPHLLMLPFIRNMAMWQTGMAAAPMSMLSYAASVAGIWRLSRRMMRVRWALVATAFYCLNANLLFLATTAMTEALFLALLIWAVVATMEGISALKDSDAIKANGRMMLAGLMVLGMVFTRYDGWIVGALVWACFAWAIWKSSAMTRKVSLSVFVLFTVMCAAGPLLWFWYNAHFEHDWLDFMRGPYSAKQIERRTAPPGQHYRGWHNMAWAALFYTRTAQVDAAARETGFGLMGAALYGVFVSLRSVASSSVHRGTGEGDEDSRSSKYRGFSAAAQNRVSGRDDKSLVGLFEASKDFGQRYALLLWVPLPFYIYSIAYGSVPIFIPQLWPHSYYNARYGMELLPALAVYGAIAGERLDVWLRREDAGWGKLVARFWQPLAMVLCCLNVVAMAYRIPPVLKEGMVNATTRVSLERSIALVLEDFPKDQPVMMALSAHVGAVQSAGRTLVSMVSENDSQSFDKALDDPARNAAFVIAIAGDPVAKAVDKHPEGLSELEVICTSGQPCARVYQSMLWNEGKGAIKP